MKKRNMDHLKKYQFKKGHGAKRSKRAKKTSPARSARSASPPRSTAPARSAYVIAAHGTGKKMFFDGGKRFTENARPKVFGTQAAALSMARSLLKRFPKLRRYRVTVESF